MIRVPIQMSDRHDPARPDRPKQNDRGRPSRRDPVGGLWGAPPARSALTLRLVLALFGVVVCTVGAVTAARLDLGWPSVVAIGVLGVVAVVDVLVVGRRKMRGERGSLPPQSASGRATLVHPDSRRSKVA